MELLLIKYCQTTKGDGRTQHQLISDQMEEGQQFFKFIRAVILSNIRVSSNSAPPRCRPLTVKQSSPGHYLEDQENDHLDRAYF